MGDDGGEKTESATAKRRQDAKKRGQVARSTDLTNALVIVALLIVLPWALSTLSGGLVLMTKASLASIPSGANMPLITAFVNHAAQPVLPGLVMILSTVLVVGVGANLGQVGFNFSIETLQPNFSKLNPLSGLSRFFSRTSVFDTGKSMAKAAIFGLIAFGCLRTNWTTINQLDEVSPIMAAAIVGSVVRTMGLRVALAWGALAGMDYYWQRLQYERNLRMTKQEVKREMKELEMAPEIKMQRNIRRRRLMRQRLKDAVKAADVVITNPTHYAVALKYDSSKNYAPIVVAKGADFLAAKIREEAALSEIPLVPNPPLARALYKQCEVGDYVPRELFQAVAEVLAYVYRTLKKVRK
jgi:flagellar biosynthetic protein FlhB